ncbi:MAG: hypothetical protein OEL89_00285 [Candidatus Peregrinibacteria bacterium]|nr:hypothetical protein [Candidatus Peregrinibacteria bacterium]
MPAYKCETKLYQLDNLPCITRLINNEPVTVCPNDSEYPKDLIGITIEDYNCNRNYADELIKSCKSWKK